MTSINLLWGQCFTLLWQCVILSGSDTIENPFSKQQKQRPGKGAIFVEEGWVKLYRKIEKNDFLMEDNTAFIVFMKLLLFADKSTGSYRTGQRALADRCNLNYSTVYKALQRLQDHGVILIENHQKYSKIFITNWTVYQSNKEIDALLEQNVFISSKQSSKRKSPKLISGTVSSPVRTREARGKRKVSAREDYNKKENKELEINNTTNVVGADAPASYGNPEINGLFDLWEREIGYKVESKITANRRAAYNLIRKYGSEKLTQLIKGVALTRSDPYAPRIADFCDLQSKTTQLIAWGQKKHGTNTIGVVR